MFDLRCRPNEWPLEAGQIVFNKRGNDGLNLAALVMVDEMLKERDFWFQLSGGVSRVSDYAKSQLTT